MVAARERGEETYFSGYSEALIGNRSEFARGDCEADTGEDVGVVALARSECRSLAANVQSHLAEGRTARKYAGALIQNSD